MNRYKLRAIVEFVRREGWPTENVVNSAPAIDDVLASFGLKELLTRQELVVVKGELREIAEAEAFMEKVRLAIDRQA